MNLSDIPELHFIASISDAPSIMDKGILCHSLAQKLAHQDLSMPEVQGRRTNRVVPGGRPLHDYANLYIHARNPMLFVRKDRHAEICVFKIRTCFSDDGEGSMVKVLIGNLFDSDAQTLVNTVNCVGIMGKGIALDFKKRFPEMFQDYVARCERGEVRLGQPYLHRTLLPPWVLNFPTKDHWRSVARLNDIVRGLEYLLAHYKEWGITSLAVPPLGCGEGQLEWRVVGPTLYRYLDRMDIPVALYAPYGTPTQQLELAFFEAVLRLSEPTSQAERIPAAWIALVAILQRIEEQPYHWPVGRIIFQKIAYVATVKGLPTGLEHQRGSYGPFAPALKGWVTRLANNGLIREEQKGSAFVVKVGPTFADAQQVYASQLARWEGLIERVADLFIRLDTDQAEIVATVLYATEELRQQALRPTEQDVLRNVMTWKQRRKPPLNEGEVAWTIRNLAALGWLPVQASEDLLLREETPLYG